MYHICSSRGGKCVMRAQAQQPCRRIDKELAGYAKIRLEVVNEVLRCRGWVR